MAPSGADPGARGPSAILRARAEVAESVDAADSKSAALKSVWVRVPPSAPDATHRIAIADPERAHGYSAVRRLPLPDRGIEARSEHAMPGVAAVEGSFLPMQAGSASPQGLVLASSRGKSCLKRPGKSQRSPCWPSPLPPARRSATTRARN